MFQTFMYKVMLLSTSVSNFGNQSTFHSLTF